MLKEKLLIIPLLIVFTITLVFPSLANAQDRNFVIPLTKKIYCKYDRGETTLGKFRKDKFRAVKRYAQNRESNKRLKKLHKRCRKQARKFQSFGRSLEGGGSGYQPGSTITVNFPNMPQAMHGAARMVISFPDNYNDSDEFPVIFFLNSGYMTPRTHSNWTEGYIWVGLPGFTTDFQITDVIPDIDDAETTWALHLEMIAKLHQLVPNSTRNKQRIAYGGFSQGAHMTAAILASPLVRESLLEFTNDIYFIDYAGSELVKFQTWRC